MESAGENNSNTISISMSERVDDQVNTSQSKEIIASQSNSKVSRQPTRKPSWAWGHFAKIEGEKKGEEKAMCNYCQALLSCITSNGTSGMINHLGRCKKYPFNTDKRQKTLEIVSATQPNSKDGITSKHSVVAYTFNQGSCRKALAKMVIVDELPFRFIEREGFHEFCKFMQPRFIISSRSTITRDCYELFTEKKNELKSIFSKLSSRVCLTTDTWTSCQNLNYMCLTAHFIDENWTLHKKIINFSLIPSHAGIVIGRAVEKCLIEWGIDKVLTVTVDNASSNDVGIAHLQKRLNNWKGSVLQSKHLHMRCAAHILSLIVKDGLKEIDDSITRIRSAIKYVRSSPARLQRFKTCIEKEKIKCQNSVCLDVETRWNSTYLMLEVAIKFQKAFELLEVQDVKFSEELAKKGVPMESDWDYARSLLPFLHKFYEATLRLSGSLYNTSNMYVTEIYGLGLIISKYCSSDDASLKLMAINMKAKFDKYWANVSKINEMIFIATILDPRCKMDYVNWIINETYEEEQAMLLQNKVKATLTLMYEFYASTNHSVNSKDNNIQRTSEMEIDDALACPNYTRKLYMKQKGGQERIEKKTELDKYLLEECEDDNDQSLNVLNWWKVNAARYQILSSMAKDVLAIPISTVASESAFSAGSRILDPFRSSLTPKMAEALICGQDWFRISHSPIYVEESIEEIEKIESDFSGVGQEKLIDMTED